MVHVESDSIVTPVESPAEVANAKRHATIGLPKCNNPAEKRFPLTPEAVGTLTHMGFTVKMESAAASYIHYSDAAYTRAGAHIVERGDALQCDIVIHLAPLEIADIRKLRRGAMLLSLANFNRNNGAEVVKELVARRVINIAIDLVRDDNGNCPFGDILLEIAGRSTMTIAASMLADPLNGKGILLGGVAGVVPCEVTIIGSCLAACAAARSAMGLGAVVRLFDDDVYSLRRALRQLGDGVIGSSLHAHVLENALRAADVVVVTSDLKGLPIDGSIDAVLKRNVLLFDLSGNPGHAFPGTRNVDLGAFDTTPNGATGFAQCNDVLIGGNASESNRRRACFVNPGSAVPRTAAMALSDTFITLLRQIAGCEVASATLPLTPGLQQATLTFMGKVVNERAARLANMRYTDINLLLSLS